MKTTALINGVAYIAHQATLASSEGPISERLADLFFQCAQIRGNRTVEQWDSLVNAAREADVSVSDALEYMEES